MIKDLRIGPLLKGEGTFRMTVGMLLFIVILSFLFPVSRAFADQGSLGAYPTNYDPSNPKTKSWFIYELKPGETKEDSITVVNTKNVPVKAKVYPVDATTTVDGAFALLNENQKQTGVGSWVTMSNTLVSIDANKSVSVPFTITIPNNVTVGDHAGGIIVQEVTTPTTQTTQGLGLTIVSRVGTRIYATVPGAKVVAMDLSNLSYKIVDGHLAFTFTMLNTGNIILTPQGKVDIKDFSGKTVDTVLLGNLGSLFPGKPVIETAISQKSAPWFGQYSATVAIDYSPLKEIAKNISFFIYIRDWREVLPVPVIIFLLALFFIMRKLFFHAHAIKKIVDEQRERRSQDIEDIKEHVKKARKQMEQVAATVLPQPTYAPAYEPNIDQMFLARHVKLLTVLVSISIIVLSSLFAFILQFLALSKVMAAQKVSQVPIITQAPTPPDVPTPTDVPVEESSMNITVLNGTDTVGLAKKVASLLETAGFPTAKVGNTDNRSGTIIQYPTNEHNGETQLEDALKSTYTNITAEATDSSEFTIIVGQ